MISPHIKAEKQTLASLLGFSCHSFAPAKPAKSNNNNNNNNNNNKIYI